MAVRQKQSFFKTPRSTRGIHPKGGTAVRLFQKSRGPGYDAEKQIPAIKRSICTGEAVAGFLDRATGKFSEVVLIRTQKDLDEFRRQYGIEETMKTIY